MFRMTSRDYNALTSKEQEQDVWNQLQHVFSEMDKRLNLPVRHEKRSANFTAQISPHGPVPSLNRYHCLHECACIL